MTSSYMDYINSITVKFIGYNGKSHLFFITNQEGRIARIRVPSIYLKTLMECSPCPDEAFKEQRNIKQLDPVLLAIYSKKLERYNEFIVSLFLEEEVEKSLIVTEEAEPTKIEESCEEEIYCEDLTAIQTEILFHINEKDSTTIKELSKIIGSSEDMIKESLDDLKDKKIVDFDGKNIRKLKVLDLCPI